MKRYVLAFVLAVIVLGPSMNARAAEPIPNLIVSYPCDGDGQDGSGSELNAVEHGITPSQDRMGNADRANCFDGVGSYLQVAETQELNPVDGVQAEVWINPTAYPVGDGISSQILIKEAQYQFVLNTDSTVSFEIGPHPWALIPSLDHVPLNQWTHLLGRFDFETRRLTFWVNGELQGSAQKEISNWENWGIGLFIGKNPSASGGYYFSGCIDDVHIMHPAPTMNFDRLSDIDCDGFVTALDLARIIDELFAGGPPAVPCPNAP